MILARGTSGFTGADLSNLINVAATKATVAGRQFVDMKTFEEAKDEIIMGMERKVEQDPRLRKITAYHEGGHALVSLYSTPLYPLHKATIVPRGESLGVVGTSFSSDTNCSDCESSRK